MRQYIINSAPLLPVTISLIAGITIAEYLHPAMTLWPFLLGSMIVSIVLYRWMIAQNIAIMTTVCLMGMTLTQWKQQEARHYTFTDQRQTIDVVIISEGSEKAKTMAFDVLMTDNGRKIKCYLQKDKRSCALKPGNGLRLTTRIQENSNYRNGRFYYRDYLTKHGFTGQCYARSNQWKLQRLSLKNLSRIDRSRITFLRWRHQLLERYRLLGAEQDVYGVIAAMTLGDKTALSRELRDTYSIVGASHVLALSGLHLSILYALFSWLTLARNRRRIISQLILVTAIWTFAFLAGLPVSMIRAATMFSVFSIFALGYRSSMTVNTLCFTAIIILLQNPYALFDVGFQLSFMAVLSIVLLSPLMDSFVSREWQWNHRLLGRLWSCLSVSVAAQIGVAPLIAYHFGRFSTYFMLTNLIILPAVYLILIGSLLMLLIAWKPIALLVVGITSILNLMLTQIARLPLASIEGLHPSIVQVILCYVAIGALYGALLRYKNIYIRLD